MRGKLPSTWYRYTLIFSSRSKRIEQINDMRQVLGDRANPVIVAGDFNSGWVKGEQELQALTSQRNLRAYLPEASHLNTYSDARLDWILISEEFIFCEYYNADDILSDHLAIISEIILKDTTAMPEECANQQ